MSCVLCNVLLRRPRPSGLRPARRSPECGGGAPDGPRVAGRGSGAVTCVMRALCTSYVQLYEATIRDFEFCSVGRAAKPCG